MAIGTAIISALAAGYQVTETRHARKDVENVAAAAEVKEAAGLKQVKDEKKSARWRAAMLADRNRRSSARAGRAGTFATSPAGIRPPKTLLGG